MKQVVFLFLVGISSLKAAHSDTSVRVKDGVAGGVEIGICRVPAVSQSFNPVNTDSGTQYSYVWSCPRGQEATLQSLLDEIKTPLQKQIDQSKRDNDLLAATIDSLKKELDGLKAELKAKKEQTSQAAK